MPSWVPLLPSQQAVLSMRYNFEYFPGIGLRRSWGFHPMRIDEGGSNMTWTFIYKRQSNECK